MLVAEVVELVEEREPPDVGTAWWTEPAAHDEKFAATTAVAMAAARTDTGLRSGPSGRPAGLSGLAPRGSGAARVTR